MRPADDDVLDRMMESLAEINVRLEGLRVSLVMLDETRQDHELRLRTMERWRGRLSPVWAAITFLLGVVVSTLLQRVFGEG